MPKAGFWKLLRDSLAPNNRTRSRADVSAAHSIVQGIAENAAAYDDPLEGEIGDVRDDTGEGLENAVEVNDGVSGSSDSTMEAGTRVDVPRHAP